MTDQIAEQLPQAQPQIIEIKDSIKLTKNTKGYNYEVRITSLDIKKLKRITTEIEKEYNIK